MDMYFTVVIILALFAAFGAWLIGLHHARRAVLVPTSWRPIFIGCSVACGFLGALATLAIGANYAPAWFVGLGGLYTGKGLILALVADLVCGYLGTRLCVRVYADEESDAGKPWGILHW